MQKKTTVKRTIVGTLSGKFYLCKNLLNNRRVWGSFLGGFFCRHQTHARYFSLASGPTQTLPTVSKTSFLFTQPQRCTKAQTIMVKFASLYKQEKWLRVWQQMWDFCASLHVSLCTQVTRQHRKSISRDRPDWVAGSFFGNTWSERNTGS